MLVLADFITVNADLLVPLFRMIKRYEKVVTGKTNTAHANNIAIPGGSIMSFLQLQNINEIGKMYKSYAIKYVFTSSVTSNTRIS